MNPIKKIKVLQGIRQGKIGGGESYLLSLIENLNRDEFEPVVLSFTDGPMIDRLEKMGVKTYVVHTEKPFDVRVWKKVKQIIEKENIDIVHAHGTRAMSNMFSAAKNKRLPLLYTCHGWSFHKGQNPIIKALRIQSEKYLTRQSNVNICGAKTNREEAQKIFGSFDAEIIYNSIDSQKFNPYGKYKDVRRELEVHENEILIGSVARFTLQKQPLQLIQSFAEVSKQVPNAKLVMVGDGELKPAVSKLIEKLQLEQKVILQPFRQDIPDVLAGIDIFVLPSLWEGLPIALLEALSMGKAVVATNVNGTPEVVEHNKNGILVDVAQLENQLPEAMIKLCFDKPLRSRLQQNAIKSTYKKYNVETLANKNQLLYKRLAGNKNHSLFCKETVELAKIL